VIIPTGNDARAAVERPLLVEKVRDIVGLYLDPPTTQRCFASMRTARFKPRPNAALLPMQPGQIDAGRPIKTARHDDLFAALMRKPAK